MLPDQDLIIHIRKRDAQAFETLFERYGKIIHRYLLNIVRSDAAAQDLVPELFLWVWTRANQWDGRVPVKA